MKSVPLGRRVSAVVALLAPVAVLVELVAVLLRRPLILVAAAGCFSLGVAAAAYAVTRPGLRRTLAAVLAVLALAASVAFVVGAVRNLLALGAMVGLIVAGGMATRHALGRDIRSLKSRPTPGEPVGPAARPVLLMNPRSGGGKVERFNLVEEARRRGIEPVVLGPRGRPAPAGRAGRRRRGRRDRDGRRGRLPGAGRRGGRGQRRRVRVRARRHPQPPGHGPRP